MPEWEKGIWERWGKLMPDEGDLGAFLKGWQVLIKNKLYYDSGTKQYYDRNHQVLTHGEVQSRYNFDPMKPQEIYKGAAQVSPRTQEIMGWQPPAEALPTPTEPTEQEELERLAAQMGISVQDLLRYQYGVPVEEEPQRGLTEWQQAQLELQKQQSWWDLQRQRELTAYKKYSWGQQRYAHQLGTGSGADIGQAQQAQMAKDWRAWNARLASVSPWPQSEIYKARENPYERTPESIGDELQAVKGEWEFAKEKADWFRKREKDPNDPLSTGRAEYFDIMGEGDIEERWSPDQQAAYGAYLAEAVAERQYGQLLNSREAQDWSEWKGRQEKGRATSRAAGWGADYGRDLPPKLPPPMPKTPAFLRKVYPELGERLPRDKEQAPMYPLSGQVWGGMLPSQREKWAGYIGWAGGKPEDLYAQMRGMQPEPRRGGAWRPARQRA